MKQQTYCSLWCIVFICPVICSLKHRAGTIYMLSAVVYNMTLTYNLLFLSCHILNYILLEVSHMFYNIIFISLWSTCIYCFYSFVNTTTVLLCLLAYFTIVLFGRHDDSCSDWQGQDKGWRKAAENTAVTAATATQGEFITVGVSTWPTSQSYQGFREHDDRSFSWNSVCTPSVCSQKGEIWILIFSFTCCLFTYHLISDKYWLLLVWIQIWVKKNVFPVCIN